MVIIGLDTILIAPITENLCDEEICHPRCFKNFNLKAFVKYKSNGNAWITSREFESYVLDLNKEMRIKR